MERTLESTGSVKTTETCLPVWIVENAQKAANHVWLEVGGIDIGVDLVDSPLVQFVDDTLSNLGSGRVMKDRLF
jgi:hypothetical protein